MASLTADAAGAACPRCQRPRAICVCDRLMSLPTPARVLILLHPREPSIYGKLRRAPRREAVSTVEAIAEALVALGEPIEVRAQLLRIFRTLVQRARDSASSAPT